MFNTIRQKEKGKRRLQVWFDIITVKCKYIHTEKGKTFFRHFCSDMHKQMKTALTENIQRKKMEFQRTTEGERERELFWEM